jgi:peptidyl-prolyl cis-trans isomerase SurA
MDEAVKRGARTWRFTCGVGGPVRLATGNKAAGQAAEEKALKLVTGPVGRMEGILVGAGALLALVALAAPSYARRKVVERIIARVNNNIITQRQYEQEEQKLRTQLAEHYSGSELETRYREMSKNLLRDLIDQDLMVQKAGDLDINVDLDVIRRLDEIRKNYNMNSLEDLQKAVEKQGLIWEDFKDDIKRQLLMREVIGREVGRTIIISREDARKYFEAHKEQFASPGGVHLAQILISNEKHKPPEAEKRAQEALAELKAGQRWEVVAEKYSDDSTAKQGGDIGFLKEGTMAPAIAQAVQKVDVNQFTDVIPVSSGYIILKVLERLRPGIPTFDQVEQRVDEALYNEQMQPALRDYLTKLRRDSYIHLAPGYVDTGAERPSDAVTARRSR